ncbi:unnamed protein product [Oncorhynchus mykiss]|uniref:Uncharacterized protein n=1 Tax=Oncorhynchus mykiss TaxID=8022 RepID=A0A060XXI5_ONCMY|nr:unnamed protein product [Oncorhynchus mykiss]
MCHPAIIHSWFCFQLLKYRRQGPATPQIHLTFLISERTMRRNDTAPTTRKLQGGIFLPKPQNAITIAVSSRVLFNMDKEQQIYEQKGMEDYLKYQIEHEMEPFAPGPAFLR